MNDISLNMNFSLIKNGMSSSYKWIIGNNMQRFIRVLDPKLGLYEDYSLGMIKPGQNL